MTDAVEDELSVFQDLGKGRDYLSAFLNFLRQSGPTVLQTEVLRQILIQSGKIREILDEETTKEGVRRMN